MVNSNDTITIRPTRPEEKNQFAYSHSIVEAILTCPVWGLVRYYNRRYYPTGRQLPLEAGSAMHDVFAAVRLWQLYRRQGLEGHFRYHAARIFNSNEQPTRFEECFEELSNERDELLSFCFKILNTNGYYDDPSDRMRTLSEMERTTIRYVDEQLSKMPEIEVWVADRDDPTAPVGIEQIFDVMVGVSGYEPIRYIGTIDAIVRQTRYDTIMIDENKTASRLDEAWRRSYEVKSQPTGYVFVARLITGAVVNKTRMIGVKIKQSRSEEDYYSFILDREEYQLVDWARSLMFAKELADRYGDDPTNAPQFTHACNRYFRACSFIDLCAATPEDRLDIYENSMVQAPLTPSQQAVSDGSTTD